MPTDISRPIYIANTHINIPNKRDPEKEAVQVHGSIHVSVLYIYLHTFEEESTWYENIEGKYP